MITRERILHLFLYDGSRGQFYWLNPPVQNQYLLGELVGSLQKNGELVAGIDNKLFKIHRLIWFLEYGTWPKMIDHLNGVRSDNRIENLRGVDSRANQQNRYYHREGRLVGAGFHKQHRRWRSSIMISGRTKHLGYFETEMEAHQRYLVEIERRGL
jgi:hypothetical protein